MSIKDWFKPIFPFFLTLLFHKLKFLISKVDFSTPVLLTKQRLGSGKPCCYFNRNIAFTKMFCVSKIYCHLYFRSPR